MQLLSFDFQFALILVDRYVDFPGQLVLGHTSFPSLDRERSRSNANRSIRWHSRHPVRTDDEMEGVLTIYLAKPTPFSHVASSDVKSS
jgi:hypothetical protein